MPYIAKITSAPAGTQKRDDENAEWTTASSEDELVFHNQVRNTQSNNFTVELYAGAVMEFASSQTVSVSNRTGVTFYRDSYGDWNEISDDGNVTAEAIGTAPGGGISVSCAVTHNYPPPPWPKK